MTTSQERRVEKALGDKEPEKDRSLRGQALHRATSEDAPRTLTAWEWEEWYVQHGVPDAHKKTARPKGIGKKFGELLLRLSGRR